MTEELEARRWLDAFRRAADAAQSAATLHAAAVAVIDAVCTAADWPVGRLLTVEGDRTVPTDVWRLGDPDRYGSLTAVAGRARLAERAVALGEPVWTGDLAEVGPVSAEALRTGLRAAAAIPVHESGRVVAVAEFFAERPDRPAPGTLAMASAALGQLARVVERS